MLALLLVLSPLACNPKPPPAPEPPAATPPAAPAEPTPADAECKTLEDGRTVCFPVDHVCSDPHGIGDGVAIVVDCWTSGGRMCHPGSEIWPVCAGGWIPAGLDTEDAKAE